MIRTRGLATSMVVMRELCHDARPRAARHFVFASSPIEEKTATNAERLHPPDLQGLGAYPMEITRTQPLIPCSCRERNFQRPDPRPSEYAHPRLRPL